MRKSALVMLVLTAIALQPSMASAYGVGAAPVTGLGAKVGRVLGISTGNTCTVPAADRQAADYIPFNQAPAKVKHHFKEVYGRSINRTESSYWKGRARCDKATEGKLTQTMTFHKEVGSFGPKPKGTSFTALVKARFASLVKNGIFN
jgi:hypothetical protein